MPEEAEGSKAEMPGPGDFFRFGDFPKVGVPTKGLGKVYI